MDEQTLFVGHPTIAFFDTEKHTKSLRQLGSTVYTEQARDPLFDKIEALRILHHGIQYKGDSGDSMMLVFGSETEAVVFAKELQTWINTEAHLPPYVAPDGEEHPFAIRMGIHTAIEEMRGGTKGDYGSREDINYAARVMSTGVGGQILLSEETYRHIEPQQFDCKAHSGRRIKDFDEKPQTIFEYKYDGKERAVPGSQYLPEWYAKLDTYISRPTMEQKILGHLGEERAGGNVTRFITLQGFGGMGKSRLALETAVKMVPYFEGELFFAKLDSPPATTENRDTLLLGYVTEQIGVAMGVPREKSTPELLPQLLPKKRLLLILDNYETVSCQAVRKWLTELLPLYPELYVLVTTRQIVGLDNLEQLVKMETMQPEEARYLLLDRIRLKKGQTWIPDQSEEQAIQEIIQLTEGIPLAIELASAWSGLRTLAQIAQGIRETPIGKQGSAPRNHFFGRGEERHQALTRSLDWSYQLLESDAQEVLPLVGLFAQEFNAETVQQIFGLQDTQERLDMLLEASLVNAEKRRDSVMLYTLLRPTRYYALEQLEHQPDRDARIAEYVTYYREFAEQHGQQAAGYQIESLEKMEQEWRNIFEAINYAIRQQDAEKVLAFNTYASEFLWRQARYVEAEVLVQEGLAIRRKTLLADHADIARDLNNLAQLYQARRRHDEAEPLYLEALQIFRQSLGENHPNTQIVQRNVQLFYQEWEENKRNSAKS